jgi:hypothetical protein
MVLRSDLTDRVRKIVPKICQNPNAFVNQCVEGCLDAMDFEEVAPDIFIVTLVRDVCRKPVLAGKWIRAICSVLAPHPEETCPRDYYYLTELLNQHEGPLTKKIVRSYWRLANEMSRAALGREEDLKAFRSKQSSS